PRLAVRLRGHRAGRAGPVAAELLARHHADPLLRRHAAVAADLRVPGLDVPDPAERHPRGVPDGAGRPAHALEHAGDPQPRVRPDGAGQGARGAGGDPAPRAPERDDPGADDPGPPDRDAAGRRRHHRVGVRVAGHGEARRGRDLLPRLPGGPDGPDPVGDDLRRDQPAGRRPLHRDRSADPVRVMGATASGPVEVPAAAPASPAAPLAVPASRPAAAARLRRHPLVLVGGAILLAVVLASALAPLLTGADPVRPSFGQRLRPPWGLGGSAARPLGADNLGRDILARLLYGGRVSLALATSAVVLATGAGVLAGLLAGWL